MKNQDRKHLFPVLENSAIIPASINRNSPAKGAIKAVLPPALPKRIIINDALSSPSRDENVDYINDPNIYYDGNNYYNSHSSMSSTFHPITSIDPENFNRFSSVSFDSSKSGCGLAKSHSTTSNRASMQSYESLTSTSSNKDSENSQQSSNSSSNSSSFCSSSSCSSFSFPNTLSNHTQSPSSINIDNFNLSNNIFLKTNKTNNNNNMQNYMSKSELKDDLVAQVGPLTIPEMLLHGVADSEMIHIWLQKINMIQYEKNFIDNAYDMATIARMDPQDLMAIGITDPKARSLFRAEIQKLKIPENLPTYRPYSLLEWLKLLNLDCYYNGLYQQGYSTIDRVTELTWEDLEEVGITKLGHQKKILLAIKKIKSIKNDDEKSYTGALQAIQDDKPVNIISNTNIYEPLSVETYNKPSNNNQPYQDVMIKMYANQNVNSPNHLDINQIEIHSKENKRNLIRSPSFDTKAPLFTFQQNMGKKSPTMMDILMNNISNDPMNYLRRRSFESLNTNEINNCSSFTNTNPNYCKPTYQYSNCDLTNPISNNNNNNNFNRQTICFQNNLSMNTFMNTNQRHEYNIDYNYEPPVGTTTLNRPKILKQNKFIPNHVPNHFRPETTTTNLIKPSEIKLNSSTSDVYSTFKKKPPPPPRRYNSILDSNSMPATPTHNFDRTHSLENTNYFNYPMDPRQHSLRNDTLFVSCIKNLTNNYLGTPPPPPTLQTSFTNIDNATKIFSNKSSRTFPMNNNNSQNAFTGHFNEQLNASSSSSGESMYFAHDNIGTIRQKPSNISQQSTCQKFNFNRPSSTSSADNVFNPFRNNVDNKKSTIDNSLEDIEMMLATLKTQLDSFE